jgi:hypothetical protein
MASFHRRGNELCHARRADDPVLHLLFDVRLPAGRRPDLGGADARARGFLLGATAGRTTLQGEGCSTRTGTACCSRRPNPAVPRLRPGVRLRDRARSSRTACVPHARAPTRTSSITSRCTTRTTAVEPAASRRDAPHAASHLAARRRRRTGGRRDRLRAGGARPGCSLGAPAVHIARNRRVRPLRHPRGAPAVLRDRCGGPGRVGARRTRQERDHQAEGPGPSDRRPRHRHRRRATVASMTTRTPATGPATPRSPTKRVDSGSATRP